MLIVRIDGKYKAKVVGKVGDDDARRPHSVLERFAEAEAKEINGTCTVRLLTATVCLPAGRTTIGKQTVIGPALWCTYYILPDV